MGYKAASTKFSRAQSSRSKQTTTYTSSTNEGITISGSAVTATTVAFVEVSNPGTASTTSPVSATITALTYLDSTNTPSSASAVDTAGGNILITGTGFTNTTRVFINDAQVTSSFVNSTSLIATVSSRLVGNALLAIFNSSNTGGALSPTPVRYSGAPVWITDSTSLYSYNGIASNITLQATGDGVLTYSLKAGSGSLPTGITLSSAGYLSGTATGYTTDTITSFTLIATDADGQATQKAFTYTVYLGDTYFNQTTLLLNGDTGNTFITDASSNRFFLTQFGDVRPSRLSPFTTGGGSAYFDGNGDYLTVPTFYISTSDYTVEAWIRSTSLTNTVQSILVYGSLGNTFRLFFNVDKIIFYLGSSAIFTGTAGSVQPNVWTHVAVTRSGTGANNTKLFLNGNLHIQGLNNSDFNAGAPLIGSEGGTTNFWEGYISNLRVVKGTALYTANFTPSISMLTPVANTQLLTLQSNVAVTSRQFVDSSANNFVITRVGNTSQGSFNPYFPSGWSAFFDGTGDYIQTPAGSIQQVIGSNGLVARTAFTAEAWVYLTQYNGLDGAFILGDMTPNAGTNNWAFGVGSDGKVRIYWFQATGKYCNGDTIIPLRTWTHIAITIDTLAIELYVNGVKQVKGGTNTSLTLPGTTTGYITVGQWNGGGANYGYFGYISNLRVVHNQVLYTANFTPSITTLVPSDVANTSLLLFRGPVLSDDSKYALPLTVGNVIVQNFSPFKSQTSIPKSYSYKFGGTGDYLSTVSSNLAMGTGDFTIESWVNPIAGTNNGVFQISGNTYGLANSNTNTLAVGISGTKAVIKANNASYTSVGNVLSNTWNHIALTRLSGNTRFFINGNLETGIGLSGNIVDTVNYVSSNIAIGGYNTTSNLLNGYISNFRVAKGSAIYTTDTFTVPTSQLSITANTGLFTANTTTLLEISNNLSITGNGNVTPSKFNPFGETSTIAVSYDQGLYGGSAYFDGTGDYISSDASPAFYMGSNPFTIEGWIYISGAQTQTFGHQIVGTYPGVNNGWGLVINRSSAPGPYGIQWVNGSPSAIALTYPTYFSPNTWYHVAIVRSNTSTGGLKAYINGSVVAVSTDSTNDTVLQTIFVGSQGSGTGYFPGYISGFRLVKGTALYTGNFVPPIAPPAPTSNTTLLLNFTSNGIVDLTGKSVIEANADARVTSNVINYGSGSYYFDGTSDFLLVNTPNTETYTFGNADFTIEMWYNPYTTSVRQTLYDARPSASEGVYPTLYLAASNSLRFYVNSTDVIVGAGLTANTWQHVAVTKTSNVTRLFINGVQTGAAYTDNNVYLNAAQRPLIGSNGTVGTSVLNGYIDDLRVTKGYSRYSGNFTVPNSAFVSR